MKIELIACTAGNIKFMKLALGHGFKYGLRLPEIVYSKLFFADQDWQKPDRGKYIHCVALHRPPMATVLDLERIVQYNEVMSWAEEISQYVENIIIIPKISGIIKKIPRSINGKRVILGYSVPTKYGGTCVAMDEFNGWPIHLLGGSPEQQIRYCSFFKGNAEVISADGNFAVKMATRYCQFYHRRRFNKARNRNWPTLAEFDGREFNGDGPSEAYRRSCISIIELWHDFRFLI